MFLIKFIFIPTLILGFAFGLAWPFGLAGLRKINEWKAGDKTVLNAVFIAVSAVLALVAGLIDIFVNYFSATILFRSLPEKGDLFLTQRIQRLLNQASGVKRPRLIFNAVEWLYIKYVVKIANHFDKTPHFKIPANIAKYF